MKKFVKVLSLVLALCLLLASCGTGGEKEGKTTELTMYTLGDKPADYDKVLVKINELLNEKIGVTLKVHFLGWGEYQKKYPLVLSGGDSADIIYAANYAGYKDYAKKGAYLEITELAKKYAPKTMEKLDENVLDCMRVNGKLYCVPPNIGGGGNNPHGFVVRGDLMDKYGIKDIKDGDDFIDYLIKVAENEDIMPYNAAASDTPVYASKYGDILSNVLVFDMTKDDEFYNKFYTHGDKEYEDYMQHQADRMREAYLKGCWPKDVLMNQTPAKDAFAVGKSASAIMNLANFNDLYAKVSAAHPEWEPRWYYRGVGEEIPIQLGVSSGLAITKKSKHPEKAMQVIELFNSDKEINRLTTYGFEGEHYIEKEPGVLSFPKGVDMSNTGFIPDQAGNWAWNNKDYMMVADTVWPEYTEVKDGLVKYGYWNPYASFSFDDTKVLNELSAVNSIIKENSGMIGWGVVDRTKVRPEEIKRLKDAGIDKVMTELKQQLDTYIKANKK